MNPRELYKRYASAVAYIAVQTPEGNESIGSAFHVGDGVFITARHVVDGNKILSIGTTIDRIVPDPKGLVMIDGKPGRYRYIHAGAGELSSGPHFHPDESVDVAALVVGGLEPPIIPLGSHLDDWLNDEAFILASVVVMGYPPIPFSRKPLLVAARAEVSAVVDTYAGRHPYFIISTMARGGFSGGLCLVEWDFALGVITEALVSDYKPSELGYMAVLSVEPIFVCLQHHRITPEAQKEGWNGFWN